MSPDPKFLEDRLAESPHDWELRRYLIEALVSNGDHDKAIKLARQAPSIPESDTELISVCDTLTVLDLWVALGMAERAVIEQPERAAAHFVKAMAVSQLGQAEAATTHYRQAVELDPSFSSPEWDAALGLGGPAPAPSQEHWEGEAEPHAQPFPEEYAEAPVEEVAEPIEGEHQHLPHPEPAASLHLVAASQIENTVRPLVDPESVPDPIALAVEPPTPGSPPLNYTSAEELELTRSHLRVNAPEGEYMDADYLLDEDGMEVTEAGLLVAEPGVLPDRLATDDAKAKRSALVVAAIVHVVLFILIGLIVVAAPKVYPPEITGIIAPSTINDVTKKQPVVQPQPRRTPVVQPSQAIKTLVASASSPVAVPVIEFETPNANIDLGTSMVANFNLGGRSAGAGTPVVFQSRCSRAERNRLLAEHGGNHDCSVAVGKALDWFVANQNSDGSWGSSHRGANTGLALLSFLGSCETPDSPKYGDVVMNGIMYLTELSERNSGILATNMDKHYPYEHGIATYAMGETYALAKHGKRQMPGVREAFGRGVQIIIEGQSNHGGWDYSYSGNDRMDLSVTAWQYQALKAARHTNLPFEGLNDAARDTVEFLEHMQAPAGGFGYSSPGNKWSLTGAGVLGLQMLGDNMSRDQIRKGINYIFRGSGGDSSWPGGLKEITYHGKGGNLYAWYYNSQACFQAGGEDWARWNNLVRDELLKAQNANGSWPESRNGRDLPNTGPVFNTAMCTLMLEVYYRYLPAGSN